MSLKFDKQSERDMKKAFRQSMQIEKRSAKETLKFFAIRVAMAGRSRTKRGKKFRKIIQNPLWTPGRGRNRSKHLRYLIVVKRQKKRDLLLPKRNKKKAGDSRVLIKRAGMAKQSWGWMLAAFGKNKGNTKKVSRKFIKVQKFFKVLTPKIILENRLTYINTLHPNIEKDVTQAALNYILKRQEQKKAKQLQKQFKR